MTYNFSFTKPLTSTSGEVHGIVSITSTLPEDQIADLQASASAEVGAELTLISIE